MKISYAITVCNELKEITELTNFLQSRIEEEDEIIIQYDTNGVTKEVSDFLTIFGEINKQTKIVSFPLNKDFATFKNNLKKNCSGDYIFQIDADEIPTEYLMQNLKTILESNNVDIVFVPRVNTVNGLTEAHIQGWGWRVNEKGWVNFPDYQTRKLVVITPLLIFLQKKGSHYTTTNKSKDKKSKTIFTIIYEKEKSTNHRY
jgi:glycosyltransferase involved in cell wall biosynthesis